MTARKPWAYSDRKQELPYGWNYLRVAVLTRDGYRCTATDQYGARCTERANQVDHIVPGNDHSTTNLRSLCEWHHNRKSSAEGNANKKRYTKRRREERHPGAM